MTSAVRRIELETLGLPVKTHCPDCAFQCGILMSQNLETRNWTVKGDARFPVNNGQLCIKGWTSGGLLELPQRLATPQIRNRAGRLAPVTWVQAFDFVADGIRGIRESHGPDAFGVFGSGALTNEKSYLLGKFARVAVGTANIDYNGRYCMSSVPPPTIGHSALIAECRSPSAISSMPKSFFS